MKPENKIAPINFGFIEPPSNPEDYYLGGGNLPRNILQENGDWTDSLPTEERQNIREIETSNCTAFGCLNQIEMYLKRQLILGLSDREEIQWYLDKGYLKKRL